MFKGSSRFPRNCFFITVGWKRVRARESVEHEIRLRQAVEQGFVRSGKEDFPGFFNSRPEGAATLL
jgi:hypothetical protein